MRILILGLVVFVVSHLIPMTSLKPKMQKLLGTGGYQAVFAIISLISLGLIILGFSSAEFVEVYDPPLWGRHVTMVLVLLAIVAVVSMIRPCRIQKFVRFPLAVGLFLWAIGHLLANGDLASVVMFGTFALYCMISIVWGLRTTSPQSFVTELRADFLVIGGALVIYVLIFAAHPYIIGMPILH